MGKTAEAELAGSALLGDAVASSVTENIRHVKDGL
jgi:hypothetical protein